MPTFVHVQTNGDTVHSIIIPNLLSGHNGQYICQGISDGVKFKAVAYLYIGSEYSNIAVACYL